MKIVNMIAASRYRTISTVVLLCMAATAAMAQTDTISGVINLYTRLTWVECTNRSTIEVQDPLGFHPGDRILLIQMRGASVDTDNDSSFGTPNYGNAGHYELATVDEVRGRLFTLKYELSRSYTLTEVVQVIRVPVYANVVVAGNIGPKPWNDTSGGVVAFIATGTVTLNADVMATGSGFRGVRSQDSDSGWDGRSSFEYTGIGGITSYFNSLSRTDSGGIKGEGIHKPVLPYSCGRGNLANGGGGGNAMESGGGGGGNGAAGGTGGNDNSNVANGGIGGRALVYSSSDRVVFLGGSGGCPGTTGEANILAGSSGGGIILIRANQINGNGHSIIANGVDEPIDSAAYTSLPGGGGGAGGVVLLDVGSYSSSVTVQASGGKGGDTRLSCTAGPGGGGGGGCIWFSGSSSTPTNVTRSVNGGASGVVVKFPGDSTPACLGSAHGATAGSNGVILTNYAIPEGTIPR